MEETVKLNAIALSVSSRTETLIADMKYTCLLYNVRQYVIHLIREVYKYKCIYYLTNGRETSDPDLLRCFMLKRAFEFRPLSLSNLIHFK